VEECGFVQIQITAIINNRRDTAEVRSQESGVRSKTGLVSRFKF